MSGTSPALGSSPSLPPATEATGPAPVTSPSALVDPRKSCARCGTLHTPERKECPICGLERPPDWRQGLDAAECRRKHIFAPDSSIRDKVMIILPMRHSGMSFEEIAEHLKLSPRTVKDYIHIAGRNGWLDLTDPKEKIDYQLIHKVVRNLDEMLDSPDPEVKERVTMKTAEGTVFKQYGMQIGQVMPASTILAIKIEMPPGVQSEPREDALGGVPAYIEAEVAK